MSNGLFKSRLARGLTKDGGVSRHIGMFAARCTGLHKGRLTSNVRGLRGCLEREVCSASKYVYVQRLTRRAKCSRYCVQHIFRRIRKVSPGGFRQFIQFRGLLRIVGGVPREVQLSTLTRRYNCCSRTRVVGSFGRCTKVAPRNCRQLVAKAGVPRLRLWETLCRKKGAVDLSEVRMVANVSGFSDLGTTLDGTNIQKVAIVRMLKYNIRGKAERCRISRLRRVRLLPGRRVGVIIRARHIGSVMRVVGRRLCANRVKSKGVFVCGLSGIVHIHANSRNRGTL